MLNSMIVSGHKEFITTSLQYDWYSHVKVNKALRSELKWLNWKSLWEEKHISKQMEMIPVYSSGCELTIHIVDFKACQVFGGAGLGSC